MNFFEISFESGFNLAIRVNWLLIVAFCGLVFGIGYLLKKTDFFLKKHSITIQEAKLGVGSSNITLCYDNSSKIIAYKLWVELNTRKIGLKFDKENDVIIEVYNSWYDFFRVARELIKELPVKNTKYSLELVELATNVLNSGLRPHLTKWQARYRKWYENAVCDNDDELSPQEIQMKYPEYDALIADIEKTNNRMLEYKELMYKIAFDK